MKKIFLMLAVAAVALTANAQNNGSFTGNKFFDNWYIGVNGGVGGATTNFDANGNAGVRVGKYISPSFGLGLEDNYYFTAKADGVKLSNDGYNQLGFFGNVNLMNAIAGYKGQPRDFEISFLTGFYWGRNLGNFNALKERNIFLNKFAFDFAYNFGNDKQWQVYIEPALNYAVAGVEAYRDWRAEYNINSSFININAGISYKFKTSNGTHNFMLVDAKDPKEIEDLNASINALRASDDAKAAVIVQKNKQIADLQSALDQCNKKPVATTTTTAVLPVVPAVFFQCGRSYITAAQMQNVKIVGDVLKAHPEYKVNIKGYASTEGNPDKNIKLGVNRANAVKKALMKRFGIAEDRISAEGCGATDKLFSVFEFNRVAMMEVNK